MIENGKYRSAAIALILCIMVVIAVAVLWHKRDIPDAVNSEAISVDKLIVDKSIINDDKLVPSKEGEADEDSVLTEFRVNVSEELPIADDNYKGNGDTVNVSIPFETDDIKMPESVGLGYKDNSADNMHSSLSNEKSEISSSHGNREEVDSGLSIYEGDKSTHELPLVMVR